MSDHDQKRTIVDAGGRIWAIVSDEPMRIYTADPDLSKRVRLSMSKWRQIKKRPRGGQQ
jgi:hypothetical protein